MNAEARERIQEAEQLHALHLGLRNCGIEGELPLELAQPTWLMHCESDGNGLKRLLCSPKNWGSESSGTFSVACLSELQWLSSPNIHVKNFTPLAQMMHVEGLRLDDTSVIDLIKI